MEYVALTLWTNIRAHTEYLQRLIITIYHFKSSKHIICEKWNWTKKSTQHKIWFPFHRFGDIISRGVRDLFHEEGFCIVENKYSPNGSHVTIYKSVCIFLYTNISKQIHLPQQCLEQCWLAPTTSEPERVLGAECVMHLYISAGSSIFRRSTDFITDYVDLGCFPLSLFSVIAVCSSGAALPSGSSVKGECSLRKGPLFEWPWPPWPTTWEHHVSASNKRESSITYYLATTIRWLQERQFNSERMPPTTANSVAISIQFHLKSR